MKSKKISAILLALTAAFSGVVAAADCGGLEGARGSWCAGGMTFGLTHKSDVFANRAGGVALGTAWLMNSELALELDLDKLAGMAGAVAFVQYHAQHGDLSINDYSGSFAGVSNIETGQKKSQFYQAWLQQNFAGDSLSLLAGLYAVDSEFYVTETSGLFLQPPYGMSAEMAQAGRSGPPVFPLGAMGVRAKYAAADGYLQIAVTDGVPGYPSNLNAGAIEKGDGTFSLAEFAYMPPAGAGLIHKTALGLWNYSASAYDLSEVDAQGNPARRADRGIYFLTERTLLAEAGSPGQGLAAFLRFGAVNKSVYQAEWSASLGFNYQGWLAGRENDACGFATTTSHTSAKYRQLNASDSAETVFELTYRAQVQDWLAVQPSLQYIQNPNMDSTLPDAKVIGVRLEISI